MGLIASPPGVTFTVRLATGLVAAGDFAMCPGDHA
jgi:hypothetical protein